MEVFPERHWPNQFDHGRDPPLANLGTVLKEEDLKVWIWLNVEWMPTLSSPTSNCYTNGLQ